MKRRSQLDHGLVEVFLSTISPLKPVPQSEVTDHDMSEVLVLAGVLVVGAPVVVVAGRVVVVVAAVLTVQVMPLILQPEGTAPTPAAT